MVKALIYPCLVILWVTPLTAETLRDPTQPPASYTANAVELPEVEGAAYVLQSIVRRHGAKPVAMINGQMMSVGGKIDDWILVRIGESEALLRGPGGTEKLVMSPDVEKQPVKPTLVRRQR
jgi:hypothetical protein